MKNIIRAILVAGALVVAGCGGGGGGGAAAIVQNEFMRFAYIVNSADDTVTAYAVNDATRWDKIGLLKLALHLLWILITVRPKIVVSTGAAPGYLALRIAKILRIRTVWIDSIANVEELSMSGAMAGRVADLWLTQWPHLAKSGGPYYSGSVL